MKALIVTKANAEPFEGASIKQDKNHSLFIIMHYLLVSAYIVIKGRYVLWEHL